MRAHILVIEDNHASLELMTYLLAAFDYRVSSAMDGREGFDAIRNDPPDLVLCDVQLPAMSGYDVARLAKQHTEVQTIPLIAVTALAMVGDRDRVLSAGFDGYIAKPIESELFVEQVERFLRADQLSHANPARHEVPATAAKGPLPHRHATILVVDDVALNLSLIKTMIEPFGCCVKTASSPSEAISVCEETELDLIITDIHLLGANGYDFFNYLKNASPFRRIPVFVLSASADAHEPERAIAAGAMKVFVGPIEPALLLAAIAAAVKELEEKEDGDRTCR
jgi:two-component system cell cycle response regulator